MELLLLPSALKEELLGLAHSPTTTNSSSQVGVPLFNMVFMFKLFSSNQSSLTAGCKSYLWQKLWLDKENCEVYTGSTHCFGRGTFTVLSKGWFLGWWYHVLPPHPSRHCIRALLRLIKTAPRVAPLWLSSPTESWTPALRREAPERQRLSEETEQEQEEESVRHPTPCCSTAFGPRTSGARPKARRGTRKGSTHWSGGTSHRRGPEKGSDTGTETAGGAAAAADPRLPPPHHPSPARQKPTQ